MHAERTKKVEFSVVLPAHNEAGRVEEAVKETKRALEEFLRSGAFEIIIAEDGSTDGTAEIARRIAALVPAVTHLHSDARLGRGTALNRAFKHAKGEVLAYLDADLSTEMSHLKPLLWAVKKEGGEGYDFATGSRMLKNSEVKRSFKRAAMTRVFNFLVRRILNSKIRDHQCGFKSFRRDALVSLLDEIKDNHWFWDTELLVRAQRRGYKIKEIPVRWEDKGGAGTKVNSLKDGLTMFYKIIKLRFAISSKS